MVGDIVAVEAVVAIAGHGVLDQAASSDADELHAIQSGVAASGQVEHHVLVERCAIDPVHTAIAVSQVQAPTQGGLCLQGQDFVGVVVGVVHAQRGAIACQLHRVESAGFASGGVLEGKSPGARHLFAAQTVDAKGIGQAQIGRGGRACGAVVDVHARARGRDELNAQLREVGVREIEPQRDMLQGHVLRDVEGVGQGATVHHRPVGIDQAGGEAQFVGRGLRLGGEQVPDLGHAHGVVGVDHAVAVVLAVVQAPAIPVVGFVPAPSEVLGVGGAAIDAACAHSAEGQDGVHIAPAQQGVGVQHQSHHARHNRRGSRSAAKGVGVVPGLQAVVARTGAGDVGGDGTGRCADQDVRTVSGIAGNVAIGTDRGHGDAVLRGVKPVAVAVFVVVAR